MNKSLVPKIRFKRFNDEWKKYKLNDIGFFFRGLYKKTKADFEINNSNFYYVTYTNIYNNRFIKIDSLKYVNINNNEKQNRLIKDDILFTMTSETYNEVGLCSIFDSDTDNVYLNSFCSGFRIINIRAINSIFLLFLLLSIQYREKIIKMANGFTRYNLSKKLLLNLQVKIPNIIQQNKIADFFTIIDRKIELIKEKLSLLEKQKQYYLNNIFANEKSYPKIRFKGFNDEWKKYKINEIYKLKRGCVISKEILLKNKEANFFPVYSSQTSNNGIMGWTNSYLFEKNKIIWTTDGANAGTIRFVNENFYASNVCGVLIGKKDHYNNYSFAISISLEAKKHINKNGNPKLMNNIMGNINFYNSKLKNEQNLIGQFFTIIDKKIELVKEQLSLLEKQKQYYLNNMFI
ncbi:type I restriction enzyme, S subunit [Spiroplasma kunkelii CR2-3x]|uniref:Type I restriction enzyme, S subunit n=1 Tax=Spiroplasma kunkelii CR2-3x TaxID=273035 RepID=A0A0K2JHP5_SPIKU|nr:restriction endonuclease subunit S [Spiroplasma kunkelii]ALA97953.1 type I restriction enzyme, S subunit [Spiroplasma kunkelii CR2-3x]